MEGHTRFRRHTRNNNITIQGTKQVASEDVVTHSNTVDHMVVNFTANQTKHKEYARCGIMILESDITFIHIIGYSKDPDLRGRV